MPMPERQDTTGVQMPVRQQSEAASDHRDAATPIGVYVALLCIGSGSLDAISFLTLGDAFASVMTGNIVFLGISAIQGSTELAMYCGTALIGYAVGGAAASRLAHRLRRVDESRMWPRRVTILLGVELAILIGLAIAWLSYDGDPSRAGQHLLLAGAAFSMGIQGAAVRLLGVSVSTTYMTGALTTLLEAMATRRPFTYTERGAVVGLVSLAIGAALGTAMLEYARPAAMVVPCVGLTFVVAAAAVRHRKGS